MDIVEKLKVLMKEKRIKTVKELSVRTGINYSTLKNIFHGDVSDIRISTATKICEFFGITYDELFSNDLDLSTIRIAAYDGIDTKGLNVTDLEEINNFIKYVKSKKNK